MGHFTREVLPIRELAHGEQLAIKVFRFKGTAASSAPSAYIQAGAHGAEIQGSLVIMRLIEHLCAHPPQGDITLVPQANALGSNLKWGTYTMGRYDPLSFKNWNRSYWHALPYLNMKVLAHQLHKVSETARKQVFKEALLRGLSAFEKEKAVPGLSSPYLQTLRLQRLAITHDLVLDLHTGAKATRYLYTPRYAIADASYFKIPHIIHIDNVCGGAMEEAIFSPWWHFYDALSAYGMEAPPPIQAFTVELGSEERISYEEATEDLDGILNYLRHKGTLTDKAAVKPTSYHSCAIADFCAYVADRGGLVDFIKEPGDVLKKGDIVAQLYSFRDLHSAQDLKKTRQNLYAQKNGILITRSPSGNVMEGLELWRSMTNIKKT